MDIEKPIENLRQLGEWLMLCEDETRCKLLPISQLTSILEIVLDNLPEIYNYLGRQSLYGDYNVDRLKAEKALRDKLNLEH